ncbi:serine/threonine-protein kinase [Actinoplanes aureus]|uniref:non-specific serine/threonine protein kinase n=1 Tax=Actinoplanes aureus TaxID=2792083 RepID=A0A931CKF1_9ACTN|nr:serine/threonine-protein kinase [Actinoplanes aureus]MBG0567858.1 protein kinase [Actinoplanes aureus]
MGRTERNGHDGSLRIAGRYRLVEKLGTGGMSVVWRGYDEILGRDVAVKVLSPRLAEDRTFRDRLRQEALAAARLCHPHITGIFDFGEAPISDRLTVPYVVMELNDGESVAARIGRQGSLDWREAVMVTAEVASALATAHARGVVHRDVTPANVMLTGAGAKVVDFGISAAVGQRDAAPDGSLLGTPAYLAPERLGGASVSPATDVYALGLLLYRALTGRLPWPAGNTAEALRAHLYADPEPIPDLPGMPSGVADLCLRCLAKAPRDRPGAAEIARVLSATVGLRAIIPPLREGERPAVPSIRAVAQVPGPGRDDTRPIRSGRREASTGSGRREAAIRPGRREAVARSGRREAPVRDDAHRSALHGLVRTRLFRRHLSTLPPSGTRAANLKLRAGLRIGSALRLGAVRSLGGGLFIGRRNRDARQARTGRDRMPAIAAFATVILLAATALSWSARREAEEADRTQTTAAGADGPAVGAAAAGGTRRPRCAVRYEVRHDSGSDFEAKLTVLATAEQGSGWRVEFSYPGSQRLGSLSKAVAQHGRRVVVTGKGRSRMITLHGEYRDRNPLPLSFMLNDQTCRAEVLGSTNPESVKNNSVSATVEETPSRDSGSHKRKRPGPRRSGTPRKPAIEAPTGRAPAPALKDGPGFSLAL